MEPVYFLAYPFLIKVFMNWLQRLQNDSFFWNLFFERSSLCSVYIYSLAVLDHQHVVLSSVATHDNQKPFLLFCSLSSEISCFMLWSGATNLFSQKSLLYIFMKMPSMSTSFTSILICQIVQICFLDSDPVADHRFSTTTSFTNGPHNTPNKFCFICIGATSLTPNEFRIRKNFELSQTLLFVSNSIF